MYYSKPNKIIIAFSSKGKSAERVARQVSDTLSIKDKSIINLNAQFSLAEKLDFDTIILVSPTYGDEELERTMENFLLRSNWSVHQNKHFAVVELGLYRGYNETLLGAGTIIKRFLERQKLIQLGRILSIDSVPLGELSMIEKWVFHTIEL